MINLSGIDLLALVAQNTSLKRMASTNGGEWAGPCPFCGGRDRFRVWPEHPGGKGRWWCRVCGKWGDAIDYVMTQHGLSFPEAVTYLRLKEHVPRPVLRQHIRLRPPSPAAAPDQAWQVRAAQFAKECQNVLWGSSGRELLGYLHQRGLNDGTIRAAGLGANLADRYDGWHTWGLDADNSTRGIWLPRGVVIPWLVGGGMRCVYIRRLKGDPKYCAVKGSRNALYNFDALAPGQPAVLVEGVFDALSIRQAARDLVTPLACSTHGARQARWLARLACCPLVLLAFDADASGDEAASYWLGILSNAKRWRPYWDDINAMAQSGADIRGWVEAGLRHAGNEGADCVSIGNLSAQVCIGAAHQRHGK